MKGTYCLIALSFLLTTAVPCHAGSGRFGVWGRDPMSDLETLPPEQKRQHTDNIGRMLATGDSEDDINHFHNQPHHLGVDIGAMIPFGDYAADFGISPMLGFHLTWKAIPPFAFTFGWMRTASGQKTNPANAKLSVNAINIGAMAAWTAKRVMPFVKVEASFQFNDVSFNDGVRWATSGNDLTITTIGANGGLGIDFVVGREVSVGFDVTYHWSVPKKLNLNTGATFDLGSSFATVGFHVNF